MFRNRSTGLFHLPQITPIVMLWYDPLIHNRKTMHSPYYLSQVYIYNT
jgi:hypothetical protein